MALRDQPYIPLYIQDIMTDEKLNECSASTHGIYIKGIMCLMHKSEIYGKILLKQKYKQHESKSYAIACQLDRHLPYTTDEIKIAIQELIDEKVCFFEGDYLCQKRMIKDNDVSLKRSESGRKGGSKTQLIAKANIKANSEYEYETEDESKKEINGINYYTPKTAYEELKDQFTWVGLCSTTTKQKDDKKVLAYLRMWLAEISESVIDENDTLGLQRSIKKIQTHFFNHIKKQPELVQNIDLLKTKKHTPLEPEVILSKKEMLKLSCESILSWYGNYCKDQSIKTRLPAESFNTLHTLGLIKVSDSDSKKYKEQSEIYVVSDLKRRKVEIPVPKNGIVNKKDQFAKYRLIKGFDLMVKRKSKSAYLYDWLENLRVREINLEKNIKDALI